MILGEIKNESDIAWENISMEVEFYNKENMLIDSTHEKKYSFIIPEHEETSFKVSMDREFPKEEYVTHKIRILDARPKSRFF